MQSVSELSTSGQTAGESLRPLCVDLDGTLIRTDLLLESLLLLLRQNFFYLFVVPLWALSGKANLKHRIAQKIVFDAAAIPYNKELLAWIREQKERGRHVVLATASHRDFAERIGNHVGCFDEILASDERLNMSGEAKRAALVARFGERGFDYAGNSSKDLCVWAGCDGRIVVHASRSVLGKAKRQGPVEHIFPKPRTSLKAWLRAARVHQWVKNILVCVPLMTSHRFFDMAAIRNIAVLFFSFSACASVIYIINDLLDLPSDRAHARKSSRPFACGELSILQGLALGFVLAAVSVLLAALLPPPAQFVLLCYFSLTVLYSAWIKRKLILDVMTLACLYTVRIIAGGAATHIRLSGWLITFSFFFFLSLAICKRSSELMNLAKANKTRTSGRFYETSDLDPLNICGISSGMLACLVILMYEGSAQAQTLYATPQLLVLLCPLLFYWISRLWILTFRGALQEDPILFAVRDRVSYAVSIAMALVVGVAAFIKIPIDRLLQ